MIEDLNIFLKSLFYPRSSFNILAKRKEDGKLRFNWAIPYFIMAILVSFTMVMFTPVQKRLLPQKYAQLLENGNLTQDKYNVMINMINKTLAIQNSFSGFMIIINILITALFLYIYLYFFNINLTFNDLIIISIFGYFPISIGYVISYIYHVITKFAAFQSLIDLKKMILGFHIILKNANSFLGNFLAINNFFSLWSLFIIILGISIISRKNFYKILTIILIPWLIYSVGMAMLAGLMG